MLTRLLPSASMSPAIPEPNFDDAAAEFAKLVEQRAGALEARADHLHQQEIERLTALLAQKDAVIERLNAAPPKAAPHTPPAPALSQQTSNQPPLSISSAPYVRRGDGVVEGRFGPKEWGNRNF